MVLFYSEIGVAAHLKSMENKEFMQSSVQQLQKAGTEIDLFELALLIWQEK